MPRNIEIKAAVTDWEATSRAAARLADGPPQLLRQEDHFYRTARGRLKLRSVNDRAELIYYERPDVSGPKQSQYLVLSIPELQTAHRLLELVHGCRGVVRKERWLYLRGQTRIHLDRVENLGDFIELEVVLRDDQSAADGEAIAHRMMAELGIAQGELVEGAYIDLLS
jgi:predicted adenylyl cyclase CyaB